MSDPPPANGARDDAVENGLRYLGDDSAGIRRLRHGGGFRYVDAGGAPVRDAATLKRIRHLAIPPAWTDVWIAPIAGAHMQATGRDQRGRKQYRYHADFLAARERTKYDRVVAFGRMLGAVRRRVDADMARRGLPREKVIATVVHLLDTTLIRVGNAEYERSNGSYGLTTLRNRHVDVAGSALRFEFAGKSGRRWRLTIHDRRVARIVRSCQELPGQRLFQYVDDDGALQSIGSADVNAYLQSVTGAAVTAKDFRTFAGSVLAVGALLELPTPRSATEVKANVRAAVAAVAQRLGNTPTICRKCYIHPAILAAYLAGAPLPASGGEAAVLRFLAARDTPRKRRRIRHGEHAEPSSEAARAGA